MGLKRQREDDEEGDGADDLMTQLQQHLRHNLTLWGSTHEAGEKLLSLYRSEAQHLEELMTRTLTLGESNSAMVLAPRGTGKSALLDTVLKKLERTGSLCEGFVVRLSGLLQTDDRHALREITSQLRLETATANKVFGSFAENLSFLLESLRFGSKESSKPVLFILEEFDLFCHHRNQTLLYNLFDVAQSAQAPICVLGLTCRLDVIELLEKRVKSRFSHRHIHLFPPDAFDPHYLATFTHLLTLPPDTLPHKDFAERWNSDVASLVEDIEVRRVLKRIHTTTKDVRTLKAILLVCVSGLSGENERVDAKRLTKAHTLLSGDSKTKLLHGLSFLQLTLIIAMSHLTHTYDGEPYNFEMVLHEYLKFSRRHSHTRPLPRPVVFKAFDQLKGLELIRAVEGNTRGTQREYRLYHLLVTSEQLSTALGTIQALPTDLQQWAVSAI
ncbi:hypothetical protein Pmani_032602 [Petrolisthes manimaculis]|uniref:Origin recognition complex subunit 4 n=1 Tax=Petrolisthes manimaculis TaxID=1843537 RepID=A0AAE1TTM2_9EUCA|nr:hypothetical protein Pmani_032602 [Petrolisthes manimaculis]